MKKLQELVQKYVAGEIDFQNFRRAMVVEFLSVRNAEVAVENLASVIDVDCVEFSDGLIGEQELKQRLSERIAEFVPNPTYVMSVFRVPMVSADATLFRPSPLNVNWLAVGQLLFAAPADTESGVVFASAEPRQ